MIKQYYTVFPPKTIIPTLASVLSTYHQAPFLKQFSHEGVGVVRNSLRSALKILISEDLYGYL